MVTQLRIREGKQRGRKEHSLVIRVGNEQADPLVAQLGKP